MAMDDKNKSFSFAAEWQREYRKMQRRETYLYEKDKGRLIKFDEAYITTGTPNTIEDFISKRNLHRALVKALKELNEIEYEIIQECFFDCEKLNYSKLSKKHSISKQAYTKKVKRILIKLKKLITLYYEEF